MSLIASTVDSAMDFLSTLIVLGTSRYIEHRDWKWVDPRALELRTFLTLSF